MDRSSATLYLVSLDYSGAVRSVTTTFGIADKRLSVFGNAPRRDASTSVMFHKKLFWCIRDLARFSSAPGEYSDLVSAGDASFARANIRFDVFGSLAI